MTLILRNFCTSRGSISLTQFTASLTFRWRDRELLTCHRIRSRQNTTNYANGHEIYLVSSGIDALQPRPHDSYLEEATEWAQRAGAQVYSIYADRAGHLGHIFWRCSCGQNNLSRLADGAEACFQVMQMAISYGPYLDGVAERLKH